MARAFTSMTLIVALALCANATVYVEQLSQQELNALTFVTNKIVFDDDNVQLLNTLTDETQVVCPRRMLKKISFLKNYPASHIDNYTPTFRAYPNPTADEIIVEGISRDAYYSIFGINGNKVMDGKGNRINISGLANGTYLLQINNQTVKIIKDK